MKKLFSILPAVLLLCLSGCAEPETTPPAYLKNEAQLHDLVIKAINGDQIINDSLSMLAAELPPEQEYNKISAEEIRTLSGDRYFYVLLEHPNPYFNRIAVYDSALNLYFLDKNINGSLSIENLNLGGFEFLLLKESFLSKDIININKTHLIKLDSTEVYPVLDIYSGIKTPKLEYRQVIEELNTERIRTKITSTAGRKQSDKADVFLYSPAERKFLSSGDTFKQMVMEVIGKTSETPLLPQITDSLTAMQSTGVTLITDSADGQKLGSGKGFSFAFNEGWKKITDLVITDYLNQNLKGTKFINTQLGAEISVVAIPQKDSSEMYVRFALPQSSQGTYKVRFSQKIESVKDYLQLFEYSCGKNKFLVIFKASKKLYYKNREAFDSIINSFAMDC